MADQEKFKYRRVGAGRVGERCVGGSHQFLAQLRYTVKGEHNWFCIGGRNEDNPYTRLEDAIQHFVTDVDSLEDLQATYTLAKQEPPSARASGSKRGSSAASAGATPSKRVQRDSVLRTPPPAGVGARAGIDEALPRHGAAAGTLPAAGNNNIALPAAGNNQMDVDPVSGLTAEQQQQQQQQYMQQHIQQRQQNRRQKFKLLQRQHDQVLQGLKPAQCHQQLQQQQQQRPRNLQQVAEGLGRAAANAGIQHQHGHSQEAGPGAAAAAAAAAAADHNKLGWGGDGHLRAAAAAAGGGGTTSGAAGLGPRAAAGATGSAGQGRLGHDTVGGGMGPMAGPWADGGAAAGTPDRLGPSRSGQHASTTMLGFTQAGHAGTHEPSKELSSLHLGPGAKDETASRGAGGAADAAIKAAAAQAAMAQAATPPQPPAAHAGVNPAGGGLPPLMQVPPRASVLDLTGPSSAGTAARVPPVCSIITIGDSSSAPRSGDVTQQPPGANQQQPPPAAVPAVHVLPDDSNAHGFLSVREYGVVHEATRHTTYSHSGTTLHPEPVEAMDEKRRAKGQDALFPVTLLHRNEEGTGDSQAPCTALLKVVGRIATGGCGSTYKCAVFGAVEQQQQPQLIGYLVLKVVAASAEIYKGVPVKRPTKWRLAWKDFAGARAGGNDPNVLAVYGIGLFCAIMVYEDPATQAQATAAAAAASDSAAAQPPTFGATIIPCASAEVAKAAADSPLKDAVVLMFPVLLMPLALGDLYKISLEPTPHRGINVWAALLVTRQVLLGLLAMHRGGAIHRDIKASNILVALHPSMFANIPAFIKPSELLVFLSVMKVADTGLASLRGLAGEPLTGLGTVGYRAPEVVQGNPYNEKADVFSVACMLAMLLLGAFRFGNGIVHNKDSILDQLVDPGTPSAYLDSLAINLRAIMGEMLEDDPNHRPTLEQLLHRPLMVEVARLQADLQDPQLRNRFMGAFVQCRPEYAGIWQELQQHYLTQQHLTQQQHPQQQHLQQPDSFALKVMEVDAAQVMSGSTMLNQNVVKPLAQPHPPQLLQARALAVPRQQQEQLFGVPGNNRRDMVPFKPAGLIQLNLPLATQVLEQQQ